MKNVIDGLKCWFNTERICELEFETKKMIMKISETKSWFFEKMNKIDVFSHTDKDKREREQINKIGNERWEVITDTTGTQRTTRDYYKQYVVLQANKTNNL